MYLWREALRVDLVSPQPFPRVVLDYRECVGEVVDLFVRLTDAAFICGCVLPVPVVVAYWRPPGVGD